MHGQQKILPGHRIIPEAAEHPARHQFGATALSILLTFKHYNAVALTKKRQIFWVGSMPILENPRHEVFAQALARGLSTAAAYAEAGYKPNRGNAHTLLKQNKSIPKRVKEIQAEQLAIHQQVTAEAAANAKVTLESLIAEAEAARAKAMEEKGGAAAAVSALIAKAKLARHRRAALFLRLNDLIRGAVT